MSEITWIKIDTHLFDNEKIQLIEELPEGESILLIWIKLLILAGKKNENGYIYLTKEIPYKPEMLSKIFRKKTNIIRLSLETLESFGMILIKNEIILIKNWEKYQNVDGLNKIREQNRIRQLRFRDNQKLLESNVISNVTSQKNNVTVTQQIKTIDLERDKDLKNKIKREKIKPKKINFAEFVNMQQKEYDELIKNHGKEATEKMIEILDNYKGSSGKKYKDDYRAILMWVVDKYKEKKEPSTKTVFMTEKQRKDKEYDDRYNADLERSNRFNEESFKNDRLDKNENKYF